MFLFSKSNRRMEEHGYFIVKILFTEAWDVQYTQETSLYSLT